MTILETDNDVFRNDVMSGRRGKTKLRTDERVLARITDGIYREPASALRELIFNAYDADAANVWIQTDAPRFNEIVIKDDGEGMTFDTLQYIVGHIGGSAKRTAIGGELGLAQPDNLRSSIGGRKMIGKIGIGLFAVAQLTRHFQIVTKPRSDAYRYIADIRLKTHTEDQLAEIKTASTKMVFETGDVEVWREPASDTESHGTQIVLMDLKRNSRELLQSHERWLLHKTKDMVDELERPAPRYHIGSVRSDACDQVEDDARLPWGPEASPREKFQKLYQSVLSEVADTKPVPELFDTFDYYLKMLWTLALSAPVDYVEKHPFLITQDDNVRAFVLSNRDREAPTELILGPNQTIADAAKLTVPVSTGFEVFVDGVQLLRPIRFTNLPSRSKSSQTKPLLFVAKCKPDLRAIPEDAVGGRELSFEGYFFWTPTVVPKDNNGLMVRLGNASGALFDDSFMRYEVSEQTRLRQITAELFISDGLDAALNIDRESFNYSHPHYQFLTKWVHRALRHLASKHKSIGSELNTEAKEQKKQKVRKRIENIVEETWTSAPAAGDETPTDVIFVDDDLTLEAKQHRMEGALVFPRRVLEDSSEKKLKERDHFEEQIKAVAQIMDGYGLLTSLTYKQQEELLRAIARVFLSGGE